MRTVVVIDCNRNGLAAIRSFGKRGIRVIGVDHSWRKSGLFSKYIYRRHIVPRPHVNESAFIEALERIGKKYLKDEKPYLLPVNDEYVRTLAAHWSQLGTLFTPLFETDQGMLDNIANKVNFSDYCAQIDIPQPTRYTEEDVLNDREVEYPLIFKPDERRSLENMASSVFRVKLFEDVRAAKEFVLEMKKLGIKLIIQRYIPGGDDCLFTAGIAATEGRLLGCFTGKKVRQFPPLTGQASLAKSVQSEKLVVYSERLISSLGFTGIAQVEFKLFDDELYVIEMNPRAWSWHGLAQPSGVDLPMLLLDGVSHDLPTSTPVITNQTNGLYWHYFIEDLIYNVFKNRNITLWSLLKSFVNADYRAFFDRSDIMPALAHVCIEYPIRLGILVFKGK